MAGLFDDIAPPAGVKPAAGAGLFDDIVPPKAAPKRVIGEGEAAARGLGSGLAGQGNVLALAASAPAVLADTVANLFRAKPSTAMQDAVFSAIVDPVTRAKEFYAPGADEQMATRGGVPTGEIANVGGNLGAMLPAMIASGGAQSSVMLPKIVEMLFRGGVAAQPSFALPATVNRAQELLAANVDPATVAKASAVNLLGNTAMGALPVSRAGGALTRMSTGAGINAGTGVATRGAEALALGDENASVAQPAFGGKEMGMDAGIGALMALALGPRGAAATAASRPGARPADTGAGGAPDIPVNPGDGMSVADRLAQMIQEQATAEQRAARERELAQAFSGKETVLRRGDVVADPQARETISVRPDKEPTPATDQAGNTFTDPAELARSREAGADPTRRAYMDAGLNPDVEAKRARLRPEAAPEGEDARTLKASLDAEQVALVDKYMGVPPGELSALGPNSQRTLLARAMEAQSRDTARAEAGPLVSSDITAQDPNAGLTSPRSKPNVPNDRAEPQGRTFDQQDAAAQKAPDPKEIAKKRALLDRLDTLRGQLDALRRGAALTDLQRRIDLGQKLTEKELKQYNALKDQEARLAGTVFKTESDIYRAEAGSEAGSRAASGEGDRPFRGVSAEDDAYTGRMGGDAKPGETRGDYFRRKAAEAETADYQAKLDALEREWARRQKMRGEQKAKQESDRRNQQGRAEDRYAGAEQSTNATKDTASGKFNVDDGGFVMSDKGAPIWFGHQRDAGWWILKTGNKQSPTQIYEIANHPGGKGFTVRVTGETEAPKGKANESGQNAMPVLRGADRTDGNSGGAGDAGGAEVRDGGGAPRADAGDGAARNDGSAGRVVEPAAQADAAPAPKPEKPGPKPGSKFLIELRRAGGIDPAESSDIMGERGHHMNRRLPGLSRKGGMTADGLVEWLEQHGYLTRAEVEEADANGVGGSHQLARDMVRRAMDGQDVFPVGDDRAEARWRAEQEKAAEDKLYGEAAARGIDVDGKTPEQVVEAIREDEFDRQLRENDIPPDQAENADLVARAAELDEAAVERLAMQHADDDAAFMAGIKEILNGNQAKGDTAAAQDGARGAGGEQDNGRAADNRGSPDIQGDGPRVRASDGGGERAGLDAGEAAASARPDFGLEQPSADRLRTDAERRAADERARVARENAPPPEDFTLSGSDRPADQAAARGQGDIFSEPKRDRFALDGDNLNDAQRELRAASKGAEADGDVRLNNGKFVPFDTARRLATEAYGRGHTSPAQLAMRLDINPRDADRLLAAIKDSGRKTDGSTGQGGKGSGGTFSGGFVPKPVVDAIAKAWGWTVGDAKAWDKSLAETRNAIEDTKKSRTLTERGNPVVAFLRSTFDTSTGDMRAAARMNGDAKTVHWAIDQFSDKAGGTEAHGETLPAAVRQTVNGKLRAMGRVLGDSIHDRAAMEQVAALLRNPQNARPGTKLGDMAIGLRKMLDAELKYLRGAGVDVGEVRDGYFPREYNTDAIIKDQRGFMDAAKRAYVETGLSSEAADQAAKLLHDSLVYGEHGSIFKASGGTGPAPFLKGRVFGKAVDNSSHPLNKFLVHDPAEALTRYFERSAKRAEIARRFGDNFSHWNDWKDADGKPQQGILSKIQAEGGQAAVDKLQQYVALAAGLQAPGVGHGGLRAASVLRTWGALSFLEKATIASLTEGIMPAIRSGNLLNVGRSVKDTVADLFSKSASAQERRRFAETLNIIVGDIDSSLMAARFAGGDPVGAVETKVLDRFFRRTGLTQFTDAVRVSAANQGRAFIRQLASEMADGGGKLTSRYLAELGVPPEKAKAFAEYVMARNDGMPGAGDLTGDMGDLYRVAARKFVLQSSMEPGATNKPAWMSHPIGAVVGQLQSFNYAFYENVWKRNARLAADALTAEGYSAAERAKMLYPMAMMPLLAAAAYAIGEGRDALLGDQNRRKQETTTDKLIKAASRGAPIAPIDLPLNIISSARYNKGVSESALGPVLGTTTKAIDASLDFMLKNSENTNTQERRAAKAVWDIFIEPTVNLALYASPVSPASAAVTQFVGSGYAREKLFVEPLAGPDKRAGQREAGRSASREAGRSATR